MQRISQSNIKFCHQNLTYPVNYDVTDWSSAICWNWSDHKSCVEILHNSARYQVAFALIIENFFSLLSYFSIEVF